jgi:hypothetical protein
LVQAKRGSGEESEEESSVDEELVVHGQWLKGSGSWLHASASLLRDCALIEAVIALIEALIEASCCA